MIDDVQHALLTKLRAKECDGRAALAIADWLKASIEDEAAPGGRGPLRSGPGEHP